MFVLSESESVLFSLQLFINSFDKNTYVIFIVIILYFYLIKGNQ